MLVYQRVLYIIMIGMGILLWYPIIYIIMISQLYPNHYHWYPIILLLWLGYYWDGGKGGNTWKYWAKTKVSVSVRQGTRALKVTSARFRYSTAWATWGPSVRSSAKFRKFWGLWVSSKAETSEQDLWEHNKKMSFRTKGLRRRSTWVQDRSGWWLRIAVCKRQIRTKHDISVWCPSQSPSGEAYCPSNPSPFHLCRGCG